jgi:hypothetical protein
MSQEEEKIWQEVYFGRSRSRRDRPLAVFSGDKENQPYWVIASASPRADRLAEVLPQPVMASSTSRIGNLLRTCPLASELQDIAGLVINYQEPTSRWSSEGDGKLSLEKARIVAAGICGWMKAAGQDLSRLPRILAKDFTVALISISGTVFLDGPFSLTDQLQLLERYRGHDGSLMIVACNATTGLRFRDYRLVNVRDIAQLADLSTPLPVHTEAITCHTYTAFRLGPWVFDLAQPYTLRHLVDYAGQHGLPPGLASLPGIGDFAVPYFAQAIEVMYPNCQRLGNPTGYRFEPLAQAALASKGYFASYPLESAVSPSIGDELVGASTLAAREIRRLFKLKKILEASRRGLS